MDAAEVAREALREDLGTRGDVTSRVVLPEDRPAHGVIASREDGVLAGCEVAGEVARLCGVAVDWELTDGARLAPGTVACRVSGGARDLLAAERSMLNLLCHLSGIATAASRYAEACAPAILLDTRKTTPGLRDLEKAAVVAGGGHNHRRGLDDRVLVKDNHIAMLPPGGLADVVARARAELPGAPVEIEADDLEGVRAALDAGADWILLDNMSPEEMRAAVALVAGRARLEASGRMDLERARAAGATGVDAVSVGWITHSAPTLDLGLDFRTP